MSLGPQCLQCKRRRVKCDSGKPQCNKCAKDGYECPGYTKSLQWVAFQPQSKKSRRRGKRSNPPSPFSSTGSSSVTPRDSTPIPDSTSPCHEKKVDDCQALSNVASLLSPCLYTNVDKRAFRVFDTITFFNTELCPDLSASHWQGKEPISVGYWLTRVPTLMQDMVAVTVFAYQALRYSCPVEKTMYEHRGLMLQGLRQYLRTPSEQSDILSLHMLVGIMQQEAYLSPIRDFRVHLDAARRIIVELGGIKACLSQWPASGEQLASFVYVDIFSATTTPVSNLTLQGISIQKQYLQQFPHFEDYLLDSPCPSPVAIFESLIRITELRVTPYLTQEEWRLHFLEVLEEIQTFNPWKWASSLDCIPEDEGVDAVNEWATCASCHQAGAIIYLVESARFSKHLSDDINLKNLSTAIASEARDQLRQDLKYLFSQYPCRMATPQNPQLWRFVVWPMVMYAYETFSLGITRPEEAVILQGETLWEEFGRVGVVLSSHSLLAALRMLERWAMRDGRGEGLVWDELFSEGCVFHI